MIATLMEKVGREGSITVEDGKKLQHEIEYIEGMNIDQGFLSPDFITNLKNQKCEFDDCAVLVTDEKISRPQQILNILNYVMTENTPLLIIAEDIEGDALKTLISNRLQNNMKVCAIKAPLFGENRKKKLEDIAIITGAQYYSKDIGLELEHANEGI